MFFSGPAAGPRFLLGSLPQRDQWEWRSCVTQLIKMPEISYPQSRHNLWVWVSCRTYIAGTQFILQANHLPRFWHDPWVWIPCNSYTADTKLIPQAKPWPVQIHTLHSWFHTISVNANALLLGCRCWLCSTPTRSRDRSKAWISRHHLQQSCVVHDAKSISDR